MKKTIIFGNNNVAEMIYLETQKYDEKFFAIEAFCVDKEYKEKDFFCNKPLCSLDEVIKKYPPNEFDMLSTVLGSGNGLRKKNITFDKLKNLGYTLANYVSPLADVSPNVKMGENNIILSFSNIGLNARLGNSNMFWYNTLLDHDANVGDGNFFAGGCKTAGFINIGNYCWFGLNSTIIGNLNIADETLIGAGAVVIRDTQAFTTYVGNPAKAISTHKDEGIVIDGRVTSKI